MAIAQRMYCFAAPSRQGYPKPLMSSFHMLQDGANAFFLIISQKYRAMFLGDRCDASGSMRYHKIDSVFGTAATRGVNPYGQTFEEMPSMRKGRQSSEHSAWQIA